MKNRTFFTLLILCIFAAFAGCQEEQGAKSPIANPSFELSDQDQPASWTQNTWGGNAAYKYDSSVARTGTHSVMIESSRGADASWSTQVKLKPFSKYKLTGYIKTENLERGSGRGAQLNFQGRQWRSQAVTGTTDWTLIEHEFDTMDGNNGMQINCLFGGWGQSTGKAWFDDITVTFLGSEEIAPQVATIDAADKKEPLSKYIYGQFIEHLGRCIYGGIWAEMLEDRKFWYPVNETYEHIENPGNPFRAIRNSPWKIVGPTENIKMVEQDSYVGQQTPQINAIGTTPVGITQAELALIKNKEYTGRVVIAGNPDAAPVIVSLIWGQGPENRDSMTISKITEDYQKYNFNFKSGTSTENARLEIVALGKGKLNIGTASIMPTENIDGMRPDVLELLKQLDSPVYRWPGGNFVSGYDFRDGLDPDRDKRPPRKNPAWTGVEHNDFGMHEFINFCKIINTEPMIAVNTGLGPVEDTAKQVEYANGSTFTEMGKLRAMNGSTMPFNVKFWCVGNEMFGGWQLGNMPVSDYAKKQNECVDAMRKVDHSLILIAVGDVGTRNWNQTIMSQCADHMDYISEHFYCQDGGGTLGHAWAVPRQIKSKADAHRRYRENIDALKDKDIRIALDEWNYWYGPHVFGELGTRYFLKDAIGIAAGINEYSRNSDIIYMANYAQTVNVIGCIKASKTAAEFETTGLVLKLYRKEFGQIPVGVAGEFKTIDVAAALTEDGKKLTISIINPLDQALDLPIELNNVTLTGKGTRWVMTDDDPLVYNEPGKPRKVDFVEKKVSSFPSKVKVAPQSVTLYSLDIK